MQGVIIDKVVEAMRRVLPFSVSINSQGEIERYEKDSPVEVSIGLTDTIKGELSIRANHSFFDKIGLQMFGVEVGKDPDLLQSFAGEILNIIGGNFSSLIFEDGYKIDITIPTVRLNVGSYISAYSLFHADLNVEDENIVVLLTYVEN